jgi:phosphoribosylaminoimidazole-succinocarboxamide synthase
MPINSRPLLFKDYAPPRRRQLCEGTGKILYDGPEPGTHVLYFKDDVALENTTTLTVCGKGVFNNRISDLLMSRLNDLGIDTHFIRTLNMREQLVRSTEPLPFSVTLHNAAFGTFAKRLGLEEGLFFSKPIPEFFLRSNELGNPIVAAEHLTTLGWSRFEEIDDILLTSQRINDFLSGQFLALNIRLISFTLEFGRFYASDLMDSQIMLTDELSPETCDLFDLRTENRLDRQGIQDNPEQALEIYQEVASRLGILGLTPPDFSSLSQDADPSKKTPVTKLLDKKKKSSWP